MLTHDVQSQAISRDSPTGCNFKMPKDWFVVNVCAAMAHEDSIGESQHVQDDMDVAERKVPESQQVQDEAQHVKAELGLLEDAGTKLGLLEQATLGFALPSLCSTASSASSSPHTTTTSGESADSSSCFGSLLDDGNLDSIGDLENVQTISSLCQCCEAAPRTRGQRWCMA